MNALHWLNKAMSHLPLVDKQDLSVLASVMTDLEQAAEFPEAASIKAQLRKTCSLAETMILGETDFESGMKRLYQSISKMLESTEENETSVQEEAGSELQELRTRFASSQGSVLEDFEAAVLEMDKKETVDYGTVKRMLHTWKGEFGVLECPEVSSLIHSLEEEISSGSSGADCFLKLKDFLAGQMQQLAEGLEIKVSDSIRDSILHSSEQPKHKQSIPRSQFIEADPSLLKDFAVEARDHIQVAEVVLLELETDPQNADHLNSVFRACHTIKGVAGFIGLNEIAELSHSVENLMDQARRGELILTAGHIDVILQATDCLKEFITIVENYLGGAPYTIPVTFSEILDKLRFPFAENASEVKMSAKQKKVGQILLEQGAVSEQDIDAALKKQAQGDERKVGEILLEEQKVSAREIGGALATQVNAKSHHVEDTIRVPVSKLDQLIDAIGEAVIAQSMITADPVMKQSADQSLQTKLAQTAMIMRQVQELSMSLRMVSVKPVFQKMVRLVRDLCKKVGKEVDLVLEGEDTEIDKSVVENIGDPLMHMIRNSIDHGIEMPEERVAKGKPAKGTVVLRAYHKAGNVFIEIQDNGKGLDRSMICEKALSKGLVASTESLSDAEVYQFIFLPGFSTAKVVTDISGRGVGMDVVRRNIENLRGSVEIGSQQGVGTTFTIRLPLTLAIIDGMVVRSGESVYIVPTLSILETMDASGDSVVSVLGKGEMLKVRENFIPVVRMSTIFDESSGKNDAHIALIVEDMLGHKVGLIVNEIIGQQQVVIKNLGGGMQEVPGISGGAIMSDGNVSLIVDIGGLIKVAQNAV